LNAEHLRCCGRLYIPGRHDSYLAALSLINGVITLDSAAGQELLSLDAVRIDPAGTSLLRRIVLQDGRILETPDNERVDALAHRLNRQALRQSLRLSHWAERWRRLTLVATIAISFIALGIVALPPAMGWMADSVVEMIGPDREAVIGQIALTEADTTFLQPSWLDQAQQEPAHRLFTDLVQIAALPDTHPRLVFRHGGPKIGANAMALPGGSVVMTDELLTLLIHDEDALAGVLAHELGHIDRRHGLRLFFRTSLPDMTEYWLNHNDRQLGLRVAELVEILAANAHGQRFELEADAYSLALLQRAGRSPDGMIRALNKLSMSDQGSSSQTMHYLQSHPPTAERISHLQSLVAHPRDR